jgi:hypothetical protein
MSRPQDAVTHDHRSGKRKHDDDLLRMEEDMLSELHVSIGVQTMSAARIDYASATAAARGGRKAREDHSPRRDDKDSRYRNALHPRRPRHGYHRVIETRAAASVDVMTGCTSNSTRSDHAAIQSSSNARSSHSIT